MIITRRASTDNDPIPHGVAPPPSGAFYPNQVQVGAVGLAACMLASMGFEMLCIRSLASWCDKLPAFWGLSTRVKWRLNCVSASCLHSSNLLAHLHA